MKFLPICLNISNFEILVVGGGKAALQKLGTLVQYTDRLTVCAPEILDEIIDLGVKIIRREYFKEVLEGYSVVYACTNDRHLNRRIKLDAGEYNILTCVSDDPKICYFASPAVFRKNFMSIAVSSDAKDIRRSIAWRNALREKVESNSDLFSTDKELLDITQTGFAVLSRSNILE